MVDVTEVGIHIALLGRAEYITGLREAAKVLDDFAGGSRVAGGAAKGMGVSTEEAKRAVSNLRQASVDAVAAQRAYEKALQDSAVAAKEAAASDDRAAASRARNAEAQVASSRRMRDDSLASQAVARDAVKTEEDVAERTRLAGAKKMSIWESFKQNVLGSTSAVNTASTGVATAEAENAAKIEAANARKAESWGKAMTMSKVFTVAAVVGTVAIGAATIKMASDFQASMERIHTQAGVPQEAIKGLSEGVLQLAGEVGEKPGSLADAMYHIQSSFAGAGLSAKQSMDILRVAAEGAKIGGANLVDVTNAMDAAIVSGIPGVQDYNQAMGALNTTVGIGDMTMQNLAEAMGTGVLAVVKNYGVTMRDASAALAVFGDNNIRGAQAGTALRMSVQALSTPSKQGKVDLEKLGMTANQLSEDMRTGGLNKAMTDLNDRMKAAGITGDKTGQFITEAFGKKAGTGIAILMGQFDRFQQKLGDVDKGANGFAASWEGRKQTFQQKTDEMSAAAQATGIRIGTALIPVAATVMDAFSHAFSAIGVAFDWLGGHKAVLIGIGAAVGVFMVPAFGLLTIAVWGMTAAFLASPLTWIAVAVGLLAFAVYELITHWSGVASFFVDLWNIVRDAFMGAWHFIESVWGGVSGFFSGIWDVLKGFFAQWGTTILAVLFPFISIPILIVSHWDQIVAFFKALPGNVAQALGEFAGTMVRLAIDGWNGFTAGLRNGWNATVSFFTNLPGEIARFFTAAGTWLLTSGKDILVGLGTGIITSAVAVTMWFENLPGMLKRFFTAAGVWLLTSGKDILVGLGQGIIDGWNGTVAWFQNLPGAIGRFFSNAGTWLLSTGHDILFGLIHGLETAAVDVLSWVTGLVGRFLGGFKQGLGVASPSTVFMQIGRDILQGLLNGLKAMADAVTGFFTTIWSGIKNIAEGNWTGLTSRFSSIWNGVVAVWNKVWDAVSSYFTNVWNNIKNNATAIWNAIASFFTTAWNNEVAFWKNIWQVVSDYFTTVWNNIKNTATTIWNAITSGIAAAWHWLYDNAIKPVGALIMAALQLVGSVFTWLWHNVIEPVVHGIEALWNFLYANVIKPVGDFIIGGLRLLGDTFTWLWHNIVEVVVHGIETLWHFLYDNVTKPVIDLIIAAIHLFADAANWLWHNIIDPAWHGIGNIIEATWTNVIHPAFQAVVGGLEWLGQHFQSAVDNIGNIWNKIRGFLSKPINFLINTVWNGGILKAWNMVAGLIALPPVAPLTPIPEFASGGAINAEQGGPLAGPGTGTSDSILARVSAGEFVVREAIAARVPSFLAALNDGQAEAVQAAGGSRDKMGYAAGGPVGADPRVAAGQQFAQSMAGKPYIWGGTGPAGMDCSGFTGAVTHVLRGESPFAGRIGTTNTMPWPGFAPGLGGAWSLGWNGQHMAGTLAGVNIESSQTPIIYPGAHGADSGQFTGKAFLPQIGGAFAPGGAGGGGGGFLDIIGPAIRAAFELLTNPVIAAIKKLTGPPPPAYNAVPGGIATTARDKLLDFMLSKVPSGSGGSAEIGPLGASHAADIVSATKSKGLHSDAATIAIMTGLAESGLRVLANPNVPASMGIPHEGIGSDHDSVGIFQQRQSWGPTPLLMNPFGSAQLFLNRLGGGPYGDFGSAAQRVQVSAFPGAYSKFQGQAAGLVGPAFASGGIVGAMDGGVFGGTREFGGPISPGMTYMVGESGRELVVPTSPGMVLPAPVTAALADSAGAGGGGRGGRGDVHFNAGAIVVQAAHDPVATANMVADVVADRMARG